MSEKKSITLLVAGILLIIGAALSLLLLLIGGVFTALLAYGGMAGARILVLSVVLALVLVVFQLIVGILGVANFKKPEKAQKCIIFGIILLVLAVIDSVISLVSSTDYSIVSMSFSILLPALYLVGAFQLKKSL